MAKLPNVDMLVAAYFRTSNTAQSLEIQDRCVSRMLEGVSPETIQRYEDIGVSTANRNQGQPKLQQLIQDIADEKVSRVVVYSRDRIARDSLEWMKFWYHCVSHHVSLDVAEDGNYE